MNASRYANVEEYLATLDSVRAGTLRTIIDTILADFPELYVTIAWNAPQIKWGKKYVFGVGAASKHLLIAPWSRKVLDDFRPRLEPLVALKHTIRIPVDWTVDRALLKDMVQGVLDELDSEE